MATRMTALVGVLALSSVILIGASQPASAHAAPEDTTTTNQPSGANASGTRTAESQEDILQLFQATYGPEEGRARYERWHATKGLPLEQYLGEATSTATPSNETSPATTIASATTPAPPPAAQANASTPLPRGAGYQLTEGDSLSIAVWQWPDLRDEHIIVRPDGKISFPLVGDVQAMGLTVAQFNDLLTTQLRRYIKNPQVTVTIREFGGRKVIILGEVKAPGVYRPTRRASVLEAIALAGGLNEAAQTKHVVILRGDANDHQTLVLNLQPALKGRSTFFQNNVTVEPEDIIVVPPSFISKAKGAVAYALSQASAIATTYLVVDDVRLRRNAQNNKTSK